jgi:hypothetical protein
VAEHDEPKRPRLPKSLNSAHNEEERERCIESSDRSAGFVASSSGYRAGNCKEHHWVLDWALISLREERPIVNIIDGTPKALSFGYTRDGTGTIAGWTKQH